MYVVSVIIKKLFISAVVDLNGRFFGGRQVKAGFYSWEKLNNLELLD